MSDPPAPLPERRAQYRRADDDRFQLAVEGANDGIWDWDIENNTVYLSPRWKSLLGYADHEISNNLVEWLSRIHTDDRARVIAGVTDYLEGTTTNYEIEYRLRHKDGSWRWVISRGSARRYDDGRPYRLAGSNTDITARKQAEAQLRETEAQYRSIFEATSDGMIIHDLAGYIVQANPALCRMHGYTSEEMLGRHLSILITHEDQPRIPAYLATVRDGGAFTAQALGARKDGSVFHAEIQSSTIIYRGTLHVLAVSRDITERVQAYQLLEQRVAERTREITTLLDIARNVASTLELQPLLDLILEQLKVVVDYQNAGLYTIDEDSFISAGYRGPLKQEDVVHRRIPFGMLPLHTRVVRDQAPLIIDDLHTIDPAGEYGPAAALMLQTSHDSTASWLGVPLMVKDRVIGMLSISSPQPGYYTQRHADLAMAIATQAAVALENAKLYERAQEVATLEERQRLARELHDSVSQALYSIGLAANAARLLIDRDPPQAAAPLDYLIALTEAGITEMRALIFELRPESLEQEGLIAALEKQAAALSARHRIAVHADLGTEPVLPLETKEALYRIGQEAMHNVVKHARAKRVEIRLTVEPDKVTLRVADDGKGFAVDGAFPGHLGLRSMRERAARLDGAIEIISAPGEGTCVRATLPVALATVKDRGRQTTPQPAGA